MTNPISSAEALHLEPVFEDDDSVGATHGVCCPECEEDESLQVCVTRWLDLREGGDIADTKAEWDIHDDSEMHCWQCGFTGLMKHFMAAQKARDDE